MPLFDPPVSPRLLWPINAPWPNRRARGLLNLFQISFPQLVYDLDLGIKQANAQAFLENNQRRVRLYGGIARHRRISAAGIAVVLAHETGHHLGGPPCLPFFRWLSSEERATEWAITIGLQEVFGELRAERIWRRGFQELSVLGLLQ